MRERGLEGAVHRRQGLAPAIGDRHGDELLLVSARQLDRVAAGVDEEGPVGGHIDIGGLARGMRQTTHPLVAGVQPRPLLVGDGRSDADAEEADPRSRARAAATAAAT